MNTRLVLAITGMIQLFSTAVPAASVSSGIIYDSVAIYMNLGKEEQEARKYSSAWHFYDKAAKQDPRNADIQLAIAEVCLQMKRMGPAIKALDSACRLRPADYAIQWKLVQLYFYYDQSDKVIALLPALHERFPDTKGWAFMLGKSYETIQNYGKAIDHMQLALREDSTNAEAFYHIGRMYMLMEQYKKSVPYYEHYLALDSTSNPTRTYELALVLSTVERFDSSLAFFQKALDRGYKPRDDFYMNMAYTMAEAHKATEAIALMREMLERRPMDLGLLNGVADICFQAGRYQEAIDYWAKVLAINGRDAHTIYSTGRAYIKMGKEKEGQDLCERAILMDPSLGVLKHVK